MTLLNQKDCNCGIWSETPVKTVIFGIFIPGLLHKLNFIVRESFDSGPLIELGTWVRTPANTGIQSNISFW